MEEVDAICARPRTFNSRKGVNGFATMISQLEMMLPVPAEVMAYMNLKVKEAFTELIPWADSNLLLSCACCWTWSKELSVYMMLEAEACDTIHEERSESEESSTDSDDSDGEQLKKWYFKDEHLFLLNKHTSRVYDIESRIELGIYVDGKDDLIDFFEQEEIAKKEKKYDEESDLNSSEEMCESDCSSEAS